MKKFSYQDGTVFIPRQYEREMAQTTFSFLISRFKAWRRRKLSNKTKMMRDAIKY